MAKRKIAVLGGGAASLFAVWELMKTNRDAFDITVYQVGHRLGGKGASGRREGDARIEEHGLHLMFGFYENVFRVMREAYAQHYDDMEIWKQFFKTDDTNVAMIHFLDDHQQKWEPWPVPYPQANGGGLPGDPDYDNTHLDVLTIIRNMLAWIEGLIHAHATDLLANAAPVEYASLGIDMIRETVDAWGVTDVVHSVRVQAWRIAQPFVHQLASLVEPIPRMIGDAAPLDLGRMKKLREMMEHALEAIGLPPGLLSMARFVLASASGLFEDVYLTPGADWFTLDQWDLRDWLARHGGDPHAPPVDGLYDAVFASYSQLGAGSILQAALKAAFLFKGGAIWKMQAGMGDTIFTPLFRMLQKKGVKFEFFHRVEQLHLCADGKEVAAIDFDVQTQLADPTKPYDPLIEVPGKIGGGPEVALECWPSEPRWDQLAPGPKHDFENFWQPPTGTPRTLKQGTDFDAVLLGISVAGLPPVCGELLAADPRFAAHVNTLAPATTATEAMQLWTVKAPHQPAPLIVPNTDPYDTVAQMTHLLPAENSAGAVALHYLCSALYEQSPPPPRSVTDYPGRLQQTAEADGLRWVEERAPLLWRNLTDASGAFDWTALRDPEDRAGKDRFAAQYVNAPVNLSDRYVLPVPMSHDLRLKANETRFTNLYITGDWIKTSLSIGCLECAAMGGLQAARAIALETEGAHEVPRARGDWIDDVVSRVHPNPLAATRRYRPRDGDLIAPPPYDIKCNDLYMFFLRADHDALAAAVHADLNGVSAARRYEPLADWVVLYAASLTNLSLGTTCSADEVGIWIPVRRDDDPALRMYSPYVWLNSATSTLVGRDIFGYTKQTADVTVPEQPGPIRVVADALLTAGPGQAMAVQRAPVVNALMKPPSNPKPWDPSSGLPFKDLGQLALIAAGAIGADPELVLGMFGGMQNVFLKQLLAPNGVDLSYQAIVETALVPNLATIGGKIVPGDWTIELPCYQQPMISDRLGLVGTTRFDAGMQRISVVKPLAQVWMTFQGQLLPGEEVP